MRKMTGLGWARRCLLTMGVCAAMAGCSTWRSQAPQSHPHVALIQEHIERFNAHDPAGVASLASEEVAWYSIDGGSILPNSSNADELEAGLEQYFRAIPTVRATLEHVHAAGGAYAMAFERVTWENADGEVRSQASYSCYQIIDGKIHAVWYFPAEQSR